MPFIWGLSNEECLEVNRVPLRRQEAAMMEIQCRDLGAETKLVGLSKGPPSPIIYSSSFLTTVRTVEDIVGQMVQYISWRISDD